MKPFHQLLLAIGALGSGYVLGIEYQSSARVADRVGVVSAEEMNVLPAVRSAREEAVSTVFTALLDRDDFRELARISPLLNALDSAQMRALMEQADRLTTRERNVVLPRLLAYWTWRDPEAATEWMRPYLERYAKQPWDGAGFDGEFVGAWAENAPEMAFEFAREHAGTNLAGSLLHNAILRWPDRDSTRPFQALMSYPPGKQREKVLSSLCFTWAHTDRDAALAAVATLPPGTEREGALGEILANLAAKDPTRVFEEAAAHGLTNPSWLAVLLKEAAQEDPVIAVDWLEKQSPEFLSQIGPVAAELWARKDPVAAFAWAQEHGISLVEAGARRAGQLPGDFFNRHGSDAGLRSPFTAAMQAQPESTLAWVRALPAGPERERFLELAIRDARDPERLKPLVHDVSPETAAHAAAMIARQLAAKSPTKGREWAESLPSGPLRDAAWTGLGAYRTEPLDIPAGRDRDAMLSGMAGGLSGSTPLKALERVVEIGDTQLRRRAFDDVMWRVTRGRIDYGPMVYSPGPSESTLQQIQEWLKKADIPPEWQKAWPL